MTFTINPPIECLEIIASLQAEGYQAYLVGGCVRDAILGRVPNDWDIATSALPEQVKAIFSRTFDTGLQHGTVSIKGSAGNIYEVTTFRADGQYTDGRHPESVEFISSIEDDLARRDFTINAIAWNETAGFVDPFGGIADIGRKAISTVGDATQRFTEDGLRILRALRFSAELEFEIEQRTLDAIVKLSHLLEKISVERKRDELCKILLSPHPERTAQLQETNCLKYISKELATTFSNHLYTASFKNLDFPLERGNEQSVLLLQLSALILSSSVSSNGSKRILSELRFSNKTVEQASKIVEHFNCTLPTNATETRVLCSKTSVELLPYIFALKSVNESRNSIDTAIDLYMQILAEKPCLSINELDISGFDLQKLGFYGKDIAVAKHKLLEIILEHPEKNVNSELCALAKSMT